MKAVIFSSGEGNRLRPTTCSMPSNMLPIMGRPIAEHTVKLLHRHNFNEVTICATYLAEETKKHFASVKIPDMKIKVETQKCLSDFFAEDDTLLISDDIITDIDITSLTDTFSTHPLIVTKPCEGEIGFGHIISDSSHRVTSYKRCVDFAHPSGSLFTGIMIVPKGTSYPDCKDIISLAEKLCECEETFSCSASCYIKTVSDFESYHRCCRDFMDKKINLPFPCDEKAPSVWIDENATVMQGAVIVPPVYIGKESFISKGARIEAYSQVGERVNVECFASVKRSIIMDNCILGEGSSLRGSILCKNVQLGFESAAYEGSVIGFGTKIGKHATIRSNVHIWPEKHIEDESNICENVIWENASLRSMFEDGSANGIINYEITPEFAATLGRSAVMLLGKKIAVSDGGFTGSSMIKNALISGILSGGGKAYDMGEQPLPITRSAVRFYNLDGGIALSGYSCDGNFCASIDIMNFLGADIENEELVRLSALVESGEAKRENAQNIFEADYLFEYKLYYLKNLINSTSGNQLGAKLLINCTNQWAQELLKSASNDLSCTFDFTDKTGDEFSSLLKSGDYDFGVVCDYKCEKLTIVKNSGEVISQFDYCALVALIIMKTFSKTKVFIPNYAPDSIEVIAKNYDCEISRAGVSAPFLMNRISKSTHDSYLHQFIYQFDAVGAIILLIDFLHTKKTTIEALYGEIPQTHTVSMDIGCAASNQEMILRELCKKYDVKGEETHDSLKVTFDNGWAIVVPRRSQSVINVIGHSFSQEFAQEIADIFTDEISKGDSI